MMSIIYIVNAQKTCNNNNYSSILLVLLIRKSVSKLCTTAYMEIKALPISPPALLDEKS